MSKVTDRSSYTFKFTFKDKCFVSASFNTLKYSSISCTAFTANIAGLPEDVLQRSGSWTDNSRYYQIINPSKASLSIWVLVKAITFSSCSSPHLPPPLTIPLSKWTLSPQKCLRSFVFHFSSACFLGIGSATHQTIEECQQSEICWEKRRNGQKWEETRKYEEMSTDFG